jgi:ferrous iron transport protein B
MISKSTKEITVALVGNPNSGKTSLYNSLTGARGDVANYHRVTVQKKSSQIVYEGYKINIIDLPGIYSLSSQSPEERIGRDFIQEYRPDIVINILDAGNLDRNLFLTTQLIEMGCPQIFVLNMVDESKKKGISLDINAMAAMLGGPVVETIASKGQGKKELLQTIVAVNEGSLKTHQIRFSYDSHLETAIHRATIMVAMLHPGIFSELQCRWLAIKLLEGDEEILQKEGEHDNLIMAVREERINLASLHGEEVDSMFAMARFGFIHGLLAEVRLTEMDPFTLMDKTRRLDNIFLNRFLGLPFFLAFMWLMFESTFTLGELPMSWIDAGVVWFSQFVSSLLPQGLLHDLIVDGIIAGVGGTIIFLPNIVILFLFLAILSETGYLSRASFLMDRMMHTFGLHGKAFIPLVMGFGCNVPAVMATRTIESEKTRLIAILINPFMSCSARLPVFILFAGAFFNEMAGTMVFLMYLISITSAMVAAIFLSKFIVKGENTPFVMELPPYRLPSVRGILFHMWEKALGFLQKVGGVIVVGSIIIWFLQAFPQTSMNENQQAEPLALHDSYLGQIGTSITPVFKPIGFDWQESVAILTGFVAKEVVVASYAVLANSEENADENSASLRNALSERMDRATALAFMVFVLLYSPCLATIGAIKRETGGWKWPLFSIGFSLSMAYILALAVSILGHQLI